MDYSERDMENAICEANLLERYGIQIIEQQYRIAYGVIDILGYCPDENCLAIIELKKDIVDESAVGQVMRYMATMYELVNELKKRDDTPEEIKNLKPGSIGILIGSNATEGVKAIVRCFPFLSFIEAGVSLDVSLYQPRYRRTQESLDADVNNFINSDVLGYISMCIAQQKETEEAAQPETEE